MVTWKEFGLTAPGLAEIGRRLLYQYKGGYASLATIRTKWHAPKTVSEKI
jgi:hypothetical protein